MREVLGRMRMYPLGIVLLSILVVGEIAALYAWLPFEGEFAATALQPDSLQYVCYGLLLSGADAQSVLALSGPLFEHFSRNPQSCQWIGLSEPLVWQVYPRLFLPALIAPATILFGSWGAAIPSVLLFVGIAVLWAFATYSQPPSRSKSVTQAAYAVLAVFPLLAFTMVLWLAAILTEGPLTLLLMASAVVLASPQRYRVQVITLFVLGLLILITRQTWPLVAVLWSIGIVHRSKLTGLFPMKRSIAIVIISTLSGIFAFAVNRLIEIWTVPAGAKDARPDLPDGLGLTLSEAPEVLSAAIMSTWSDITLALGRLDLMSPLLLAASLTALLYLAHSREWALLILSITAFGMGFVSIGIFGIDFADYNTHFRYLTPAVMLSITAAVLARNRSSLGPRPETAKLRS